MSIVLESQKSYVNQHKIRDNKKITLEKEIESLEKQLEDKKTESNNLTAPFWGDALIRPIIDEIEKIMGLQHDEHDAEKGLTPFGINTRINIFFYRLKKNGKKGKLMYGITFRPFNLKKGKMSLETKKTFSGREIDHVRDPNLCDVKTIECPQKISEIINLMKKGIIA